MNEAGRTPCDAVGSSALWAWRGVSHRGGVREAPGLAGAASVGSGRDTGLAKVKRSGKSGERASPTVPASRRGEARGPPTPLGVPDGAGFTQGGGPRAPRPPGRPRPKAAVTSRPLAASLGE